MFDRFCTYPSSSRFRNPGCAQHCSVIGLSVQLVRCRKPRSQVTERLLISTMFEDVVSMAFLPDVSTYSFLIEQHFHSSLWPSSYFVWTAMLEKNFDSYARSLDRALVGTVLLEQPLNTLRLPTLHHSSNSAPFLDHTLCPDPFLQVVESTLTSMVFEM